MQARGEMPKALWAEPINEAEYVLNRTGLSRVNTKVAYELWFGKQPTEAEIVAANEGARESIQLFKVIGDMNKLKGVSILKMDNEAAIKLVENPEYHKRIIHILNKHFIVSELDTNGELIESQVTTEFQLADTFTKALATPRLQKLLNLAIKVAYNVFNVRPHSSNIKKCLKSVFEYDCPVSCVI